MSQYYIQNNLKAICLYDKDDSASSDFPNTVSFSILGRSSQQRIFSLPQTLLMVINTPCCMLKVDLRKAFDLVRWNFIFNTFKSFLVSDNFINLISESLSTAFFHLQMANLPEFSRVLEEFPKVILSHPTYQCWQCRVLLACWHQGTCPETFVFILAQNKLEFSILCLLMMLWFPSTGQVTTIMALLNV